MKWMIASDIHGSAKFCGELIDAYRRERAARLILLGDLLYHGPRNDLPEGYDPKAVIGMLNGMKESLLCVRGNCDAEVDAMVLDFPIMAEYALLGLGSRTVFITHGHKFNEENLPPLKNGDILLHGHTHVPKCESHEAAGGRPSFVCMNPGSVSLPKQGSPRGYMTAEFSAELLPTAGGASESGERWQSGLFLWKTLEGEEYQRYFVAAD